MKPIIDKIWMTQDKAIRIDWDTDYHHEIKIAPPFGPEQVIEALWHAQDSVYQYSRILEDGD